MDMTTSRDTSLRLTAICTTLALLGGLFAGAIDFNATEPQPAALLVLIFAGIVGLIQPRAAWRWAIIVALGLPLAHLILRQLGWQPRNAPEPGEYATLIALIPGFMGAYSGVLIRKAVGASR